ncbi:MAG: uracil-DNA glycosylase family protein [Silicimonas sp.]|nr:uracil-DNA glycosylase family protein [Silicimonas sp.]
MTRDFSTLMQDMRRCTICEGLELGPNPIFQLSANARILIVGQAPGRITHAKNRPFDDPSGERLRDWLGIDRQTFYDDERIGIFPMGLCFPGSGKGGDQPPRPECAETWRERALSHLNRIDLTVVMGRYAIDWHAPTFARASVTEAVKGAARAGDSLFVLPHPSPRNNRWLRTNLWFENEVVPRLQSRVRACLGRQGD